MTPTPRLTPTLRVLNPGPFGIKEHVVATILGVSSSNGSAATDVLVTIKLFYGAHITPLMAVFGIFSISILGVGLVGVLRPLIVYPSEAVYYYTLPMVAIFQMLHYEEKGHRARHFCYFFGATIIWEPIAAYICPWLNGMSIFCLASMKAPMRIRKHIARIFGGASANQGIGFLSISLDPQYVNPCEFRSKARENGQGEPELKPRHLVTIQLRMLASLSSGKQCSGLVSASAVSS